MQNPNILSFFKYNKINLKQGLIIFNIKLIAIFSK